MAGFGVGLDMFLLGLAQCSTALKAASGVGNRLCPAPKKQACAEHSSVTSGPTSLQACCAKQGRLQQARCPSLQGATTS